MNTNKKTDKGDIVARLSEIEVQEVSMVDKGANRKKWAFIKSADGQAETQVLVDRFHAAKAGDEDALIGILKELLSQLSPEVLAKLGLQLIPDGEAESAEPAGDSNTPEPTAEEMAAAAAETAQKLADEAAEKVRVLEAQLKFAEDALAKAKSELGRVGETQSRRDPSAPVAKSEDEVKTLGMRPLNK